jgi:LAO/AO transport system kinase
VTAAASFDAAEVKERVEGVLNRCAVSVARVIRWIEDEEPPAIPALKALYAHAGGAAIVGLTGPPGAGKSTLVDGLIAELRRRGRSVGVIAVDPSSPFSGGAILGDRLRMQRHAADPDVFIRSMATRGQLGGLARTTFEATLVLDAMGCDVVLVETVGVGQDEFAIADLAHTTVVMSVPGLGDEVQMLKAGILEVGDIFVLNKGDRPGADEAEGQLLTMLHLRSNPPESWAPPLLRLVATREEGVAALVDACDAHRVHLEASGELATRSAARNVSLFRELLRERAAAKILADAAADDRYAGLLDAVRTRAKDPFSAAEELLEAFGSSAAGSVS